MTSRITLTVELIIGLVTFISTLLPASFFFDVFTGVVTYASARIIWFLIGKKTLKLINHLKSKFDDNKGDK